MSNLDEIEKLAQATHDAELASRSAGVRKATADYGKLYEQAVEALKKNNAEAILMDQKGDIVSEEAAALLKTKKVEFQQASNALAVINNVNAWALDMRLHEKIYMLNHEQMALNTIERNITSLLGAYDGLEKLNPDETEKKQIANARDATKEYEKALHAWVSEYTRDAKSAALADFLKTMNRSGDAVSQMVDDYTMTKQAVVEKILASMFIATGISQEALGARLSEKAYIIERDLNDWETLNVQVQELPKLYESLRKVALTADDKNRIERASVATGEYLAAVNAWVKNDSELRQTILPKNETKRRNRDHGGPGHSKQRLEGFRRDEWGDPVHRFHFQPGYRAGVGVRHPAGCRDGLGHHALHHPADQPHHQRLGCRIERGVFRSGAGLSLVPAARPRAPASRPPPSRRPPPRWKRCLR